MLGLVLAEVGECPADAAKDLCCVVRSTAPVQGARQCEINLLVGVALRVSAKVATEFLADDELALLYFDVPDREGSLRAERGRHLRRIAVGLVGGPHLVERW